LVQDEALPAPPSEPSQPSASIAPPDADANAILMDVITAYKPAPFEFLSQKAAEVIETPSTRIQKAGQAKANEKRRGLEVTMQGRLGEENRRAAMQRTGGNEKSERAVLAGLRWLAQHQNADGSWSEDGNGPIRAAMTGLAILCFLGHGETPDSPELGPPVRKAVNCLLEVASNNRGRLSMERSFGGPGVYAHAIGAYALSEYYTLTQDQRVKDPLAQAIWYIVHGQSSDGGWSYGYSRGGNSDTSVTGWQIQALKAAYMTRLDFPYVEAALDRAMFDLKRVQGASGGFGYRTREDNFGLAGVGALCTLLWKGERDRSVSAAIHYILDRTEQDMPLNYDAPNANLYAWYYDTEACLMYGGDAWTKWNGWFQDQIADHQSPDGSWPPPPGVSGKGPTGPQQDPSGAGPCYRTTLCVLMLEAYYRYLPANWEWKGPTTAVAADQGN
jgi:hypothetical protein